MGRPTDLRDDRPMCARYTLVTPVDELIEEFEATLALPSLRPRFNIAPTDEAPIVVQTREGERRLGLARFGFIPHCANDARQGVKMLNARVETVALLEEDALEVRDGRVVLRVGEVRLLRAAGRHADRLALGLHHRTGSHAGGARRQPGEARRHRNQERRGQRQL